MVELANKAWWGTYIGMTATLVPSPRRREFWESDVADAIAASWFDESYYHVTLAFLGWLDQDRAARARRSVARHKKHTLELPVDNRSIVMGQTGDAGIAVLLNDGGLLTNLFQELGASADLQPHVTVARLMPGKDEEMLRKTPLKCRAATARLEGPFLFETRTERRAIAAAEPQR